jgi:hypothetical protein
VLVGIANPLSSISLKEEQQEHLLQKQKTATTAAEAAKTTHKGGMKSGFCN